MRYKLTQPSSYSLIFQHLPWASLSPSLPLSWSFIPSSPHPSLLISQAAAPLCSYLTAVLHQFALPSADFYLVHLLPPTSSSLPSLPPAFLRCQKHSNTTTALMFSSMNRMSSSSLSLRSIQWWKTCAHKHKLARMHLTDTHICTHTDAHRLAPPLTSLLFSLWKQQVLKEAKEKRRKKWGSSIIPKSLSRTQTYTRGKKGRERGLYVSMRAHVCVCIFMCLQRLV